MAIYSWQYLRNASAWSESEFQEVGQKLIFAHSGGIELTLAEKDYLFRFMKLLRKNGSMEYTYDHKFFQDNFPEALFHDTFLTYLYFNNLAGEFVVNLPQTRSFSHEEDMKVLNTNLRTWENYLNDPGLNNQYFVQIRKDRKKILKLIESRHKVQHIGFRRYNYQKRLVKLLSYDIHIFTQSIIEEENTQRIVLSEDFDKPILINRGKVAHILFTHYFPSLDEFRPSKSRFDHRNAPYELVDDLKILFKTLYDIYGSAANLEKVDYVFKNRAIRCRLQMAKESNTEVYLVSTWHPIEHFAAIDKINNSGISVVGNNDVSKINLYQYGTS